MGMFDTPQESSPATETEEPKGSPMKKLAIGFTILLLLAVAVRVYLIHRERQQANAPAAEAVSASYTSDQMVYPRKLHQMDMKDARDLNGKTVWVFAAGQLNAYPATASRMDYAKPGPLLLGAEPLAVVNFIEQKAPATVYSRIPKGDAQVVMLFHRKDDAKLWGTPVGDREGKFYTFFLDECFFYDDPRVLYKHWPADVWKAIDEHHAVKGMNELQTDLALGQVSKPGPGKPGDRTIVFDNDGKPVSVTFQNDKAVSIN